MELREALKRVVSGGTLERDEARATFAAVLVEGADPIQLAGLLGALATRGESASEIAGAALALRDAMIPFEHDFPDAIDTCGTGGDGLGLFNLSTAAAIVCAAAGARVIKHGNVGLSSRCGSADLLALAGVPLDLSPHAARAVLDEVGITFLFAPSYHPALRHAAPVRKSLGVRTLFNFLGPIANPGRVRRQLLGVPEARRVPQIADALGELGCERALVVHGAGGADELTLSGVNHAQAVGRAPAHTFDARALRLRAAPNEALRGGDAAANLVILTSVLAGTASAHRDAVILNAAAALVVADIARTPADGVERAQQALDSGRARATLARFVDVAQKRRSAS